MKNVRPPGTDDLIDAKAPWAQELVKIYHQQGLNRPPDPVSDPAGFDEWNRKLDAWFDLRDRTNVAARHAQARLDRQAQVEHPDATGFDWFNRTPEINPNYPVGPYTQVPDGYTNEGNEYDPTKPVDPDKENPPDEVPKGTPVKPTLDALARVMWTKLHPDRPFPSLVKDDKKPSRAPIPGVPPWANVNNTDVDGALAGTIGSHTTNTGVPGPGGYLIQTPPTGDYFNGQMDGENTGFQNPLATPIPVGKGNTYEQVTGLPEAAPYGYTQQGYPRYMPGDEDGTRSYPQGISEYAPGRKYGPTVNPYRQQSDSGEGTGGTGGTNKRI